MGTFKIKCPSCNQKLEADEAWEGMEVECPKCSHLFSLHKSTPQLHISAAENPILDDAEQLVPETITKENLTKKKLKNCGKVLQNITLRLVSQILRFLQWLYPRLVKLLQMIILKLKHFWLLCCKKFFPILKEKYLIIQTECCRIWNSMSRRKKYILTGCAIILGCALLTFSNVFSNKRKIANGLEDGTSASSNKRKIANGLEGGTSEYKTFRPIANQGEDKDFVEIKLAIVNAYSKTRYEDLSYLDYRIRHNGKFSNKEKLVEARRKYHKEITLFQKTKKGLQTQNSQVLADLGLKCVNISLPGKIIRDEELLYNGIALLSMAGDLGKSECYYTVANVAKRLGDAKTHGEYLGKASRGGVWGATLDIAELAKSTGRGLMASDYYIKALEQLKKSSNPMQKISAYGYKYYQSVILEDIAELYTRGCGDLLPDYKKALVFYSQASDFSSKYEGGIDQIVKRKMDWLKSELKK